jgi:hypothetical protein
MNIIRFQEDMQKCSAGTEQLYTRLGTCFPALLSITGSDGTSSLPALKGIFGSLSRGFETYGREEEGFFAEYNERNSRLFERLNERMSALDRINERVSAIHSDSEELEIISLNAMVISIKSGEKGRAFSCITENLKRLSARMIALSNELLVEEKRLIEKNSNLKTSFNTLLSAQKGVSVTANSGDDGADIVQALRAAEEMLDRMAESAALVSAPIREAMSGIQLQDIIRQSIDQILLAFKDLAEDGEPHTDDERLDRLTFDIELLELCGKIGLDICSNIERSIDIFSGNWARVHGILDSVEESRLAFIAKYLDRKARATSIPLLLDGMTSGFSDYIARIGVYQRGQKTMVGDSATIVSEVKHLRVIFDNIRPIITRLQHVRITQQIEVAKNPAIRSVQDTVTYMSELILQADQRVQETQKELEQFISGIDELTRGFSSEAETDHRTLERIKHEKLAFFNQMRDYQSDLARAVTSLRVYPESFNAMCVEVDGHIAALKAILASITGITTEIEKAIEENKKARDELLAHGGIESWSIQNGRLRDLVTQFTITAHKEAAGKIGGFDVEKSELDAIESGDVTLFF